MSIRNDSSKIPLPSIVDDARWIGRFSREVRKSIAALRDRRIVGGSAHAIQPKPLPFDLTLYSAGGSSYEVTVQDGWVNERSPISTGNVTFCHKPGNILTAGERTRFAIDIGEQVSLVVHVDQNGGLDSSSGDPVEISITTEDQASTHYDPPIADETSGSGGTYYYKLGVLRDADANHPLPWIERFLTGSHIDHFRELPRFKKIAGTYDVFKQFDPAAGLYKTKGFTAGDGIDILDDNQSLEIKLDYGTDGPYNGDITIRDCDGDPGASPPTPGTLKFRIRVVNGLIVGVNETTTAKPLSNEVGSNLQSCCWVDDVDHSHA